MTPRAAAERYVDMYIRIIRIWVKIKYATSVALKEDSRGFVALRFHRLLLTVLDVSIKVLSNAIEITRFDAVLAELPAIE